jgi:glycosyltransferase involved in cell wall biosynthesis
LLIADNDGASQYIGLHAPLRTPVHRGLVEVTTLTEPQILAAAKAASFGDLPREKAMKACFDIAWSRSSPTLVLFSRYGGPIAAYMMAAARAAGVPMIAHLDDDLLGVPRDLGPDKFRRYNDPARLASIRAVLEGADLIYASTHVLARRLQERGIQNRVIAGDLCCSSASAPEINYRQPPVLGYMGSGGHAADLAIATPAIIRLLNERPDLRFELFGTIPMPDALRNYSGRTAHYPYTTDYEAFVRQLCQLGWSIGLAPLARTTFNEVKCNIKWVEYTSAGIAVIASNHSVYRAVCSEGCGILVDDNDWYDAMVRLLADTSIRTTMTANARRRLQRDFSPSRLTMQLRTVFRGVGVELPLGSKDVEAESS